MYSNLLEALIKERNHLLKIAFSTTGCHFLAEDVVQDAFFRVNDSKPTEPIKQPLGYLVRIVRNLSIDKLRKLTVEHNYVSKNAHIYDQQLLETSVEKSVSDTEQLSNVFDALNEMPSRAQKAFQLHRIEGHTQKTVAKSLNVSTTLVNFMVRDAHNHCYSRVHAAI